MMFALRAGCAKYISHIGYLQYKTQPIYVSPIKHDFAKHTFCIWHCFQKSLIMMLHLSYHKQQEAKEVKRGILPFSPFCCHCHQIIRGLANEGHQRSGRGENREGYYPFRLSQKQKKTNPYFMGRQSF